MTGRSPFVTKSCRSCEGMGRCRFSDAVRLTELRMGVWAFRHWTPFNELRTDEASSPGYRHAVDRQRTRPALPYGLDIFHGAALEKVLRILWAEDGTIEVAD